MNLLIVEDEESTLLGLSNMLDWNDFGIENVLLACNGERGLKIAREYRPEIIMTDIRMPRMDGISMAEKIRVFLPDTQIIFLSAYQEIDYYKAAISLKAVNYIEKPVMSQDMQKVLVEAIENLQKNNLLQMAVSKAQAQIRESIAQKLLLPNVVFNSEQISYIEKKGFSELLTEGYITTVLVWIHTENREDSLLLMLLIRKLSQLQVASNMEILGTNHEHGCIAIHFLLAHCRAFSDYSREILRGFRQILGTFETYYITIGKTVHGFQMAYQSWQSAVILLQEIFYEPFKSVKIYNKDNRGVFGSMFYPKEKEELLHSITERQETDILEQEQQLFEKLKQECNMLPANVRNMYAAFFYSLDRQAELFHMGNEGMLSQEYWSEKLEWVNMERLHQLFYEKTKTFFEKAKQSNGQQSLIRQIHAYINQNYANDKLSLKDISEYIHMSNSHMCTFYKQETGSTINQYLTQVRMEKAKYYLKASNYSIADIAARVGYREGGYFGRIFKKTYDITPAEYRAQCKELR